MNNTIMLKPDEADRLVQSLRQRAQSIRATLDKLDSDVSSLRASWSGEASAAYARTQAQSQAALSQLTEFLNYIAGTTEQVTERHREASANVRSLWSGERAPRPRS